MDNTSQQAPASLATLALPTARSADRKIEVMHQNYCRQVSAVASAFLRADFEATLASIAITTAPSVLNSLIGPTSLMVFRLHPRQERIFLHMDCATVFGLLERLLGAGAGSQDVTARNLTEIEWSLLEEIVQVLVRPLAEAWKGIAEVEFEVESLVSEPSLLPPADSKETVLHMTFDLRLESHKGRFEILVPRVFFDSAEGAGEEHSLGMATELLAARLQRLQQAQVQFAVRLQGPTLTIEQLAALAPGQILTFDYPLNQPVTAVVNDQIEMTGHIVSSARKRAFRVEGLPAL